MATQTLRQISFANKFKEAVRRNRKRILTQAGTNLLRKYKKRIFNKNGGTNAKGSPIGKYRNTSKVWYIQDEEYQRLALSKPELEPYIRFSKIKNSLGLFAYEDKQPMEESSYQLFRKSLGLDTEDVTMSVTGKLEASFVLRVDNKDNISVEVVNTFDRVNAYEQMEDLYGPDTFMPSDREVDELFKEVTEEFEKLFDDVLSKFL